MDNYKPYIDGQAKIFKALGHPSRLMMLEALRGGELCVCELQALAGGDMSTVSKHLSILREAGIVAAEKRGTNIYYRLNLRCLDKFLSCTRDFLENRALKQVALFKKS